MSAPLSVAGLCTRGQTAVDGLRTSEVLRQNDDLGAEHEPGTEADLQRESA